MGDIGRPRGFPHYEYEYLDLDDRKIESIDVSPDPEGVRLSATELERGRAVGADGIPTRAVLSGADDFVFDVEYAGPPGSFLISDKLREVIEGFEPGLHKFWPIDVETKDGRPIGTKYILNVCQRLDTINRDLAEPSIVPGDTFI